jgi:uncharacterized protein YjlB
MFPLPAPAVWILRTNRKRDMKSFEETVAVVQKVNIIRNVLSDDGQFPNNPLLPLLVYQKALLESSGDIIEEILESNRWVNAWQDGIYDYHHYHSKTHEVLVVIQGTARLEFGGPHGLAISAEPGDVIVIPAGVAHRLAEGDDNFKVVGAYPEGQPYDIMTGKEGERPKVDENIRSVPMPVGDPIYGVDGPLIKNWTERV